MARLVFLATLLAAAVVYAAAEDTKKTLNVAFSCNDKCDSCYPAIASFTPGGECQKDGDFAYTATCDGTSGWTLKTFRGGNCENGNAVYSFTGADETTCAASSPVKYTNVQFKTIEANKVVFTLCPMKNDNQCAEPDGSNGCFSQEFTGLPKTCEEATTGDKKYYYTVGVKENKANLTVFSTMKECKSGLLPLTRLIDKETTSNCLHHQHHVRAACEAVVEEKPLTVAHSCDATCDSCYITPTTFTPGSCQEMGDDFSYKATCTRTGAWTLQTYREKGCVAGKQVYSFGGDKDTCAAYNKYTNVQFTEIKDEKVVFTLCPMKEAAGSCDDAPSGSCVTQDVTDLSKTCVEATAGDKKYYYTVGVKENKANLAVFSTKAECAKKILPLARLTGVAASKCVSYQQHVQALASVCGTTKTATIATSTSTTETTTETTTTETTTTETTITSKGSDEGESSSTDDTEAGGNNSGINTTDNGVAGVASLVAASVTAAAIAMLF